MRFKSVLLAASLLASATSHAELLGYWDFNDTAGGAVTDTLGLHDGTTDAAETDGILGNALYFDGAQTADIAFTGLPLTNMTISFWVLADPTIDMGFFNIRNDDNYSNDRHIGTLNGEGYTRVWTRDSYRPYHLENMTEEEAENAVFQEWSYALPYADDSAWHQWTLTIEEGVGLSMYVDGDLVAVKQDMDTSDFDWSTFITVGYNNDGGFTTGAIDELAIYDTAFSATEVSDFNLAYVSEVPVPFIGALSLFGLLLVRRRK
jgi:hypothetical protein